jgi:hypothetical protein
MEIIPIINESIYDELKLNKHFSFDQFMNYIFYMKLR